MRKYPTTAEIEDMQSRGFDPLVIAEQLDLVKRGQTLEALIAATSEAFSGVKLGSGVGLQEANGLDDDADEKTLATYREKDENSYWSKIPFESLNRYSSSLSFFDAEGMRFHLPAFLVASMTGDYTLDLVYNLTQSTLIESQCSLLSQTQKKTVRAYLEFVAKEEDYESDREHIKEAIEHYWSKWLAV